MCFALTHAPVHKHTHTHKKKTHTPKTDVDECSAATNPCGVTGSTCTNTDGAYTCACPTGYTFDGTTCKGERFSRRAGGAGGGGLVKTT